MMLLALTIPLMVLAVAIALVPLVVAMAREERSGTADRAGEVAPAELALAPHEPALAA